MRQTSRMRWNVSEAAVGSLFLVAVRLGEADGLPVREGLPKTMVRTRAAGSGEGARALARPGRTCRRGHKIQPPSSS